MLLLSIAWSFLLFILMAFLMYTVAALMATVIPVNRKYRNTGKEITCFISSDGIHTDFILPTTCQYFDWRSIFNPEHFVSGLSSDSVLGIGWGDKGFYLEIPTWNDLTFKVAAKAMLMPSPSLMHVYEFDTVPTDKKKLVEFKLTKEEYEKLCAYIFEHFELDAYGKVMHLPGKSYGENDNFYQSSQKYHALNTCNFWINRGLKTSGVRTSIWSPTDWGIFYQLKKVASKKTAFLS